MTNKGSPKQQGNTEANRALTQALGTTSKARQNWTCCHIWGNDDTSYQSGASEVNDPRYFSCVANMILVPTPLKAFTDFIPELKAALRIASFQLYGFVPKNRDVPALADAGAWMPTGWADGQVQGVAVPNALVQSRVKRRFEKISENLHTPPGEFYPIKQVCSVVQYWQTRQPGSLFDSIVVPK